MDAGTETHPFPFTDIRQAQKAVRAGRALALLGFDLAWLLTVAIAITQLVPGLQNAHAVAGMLASTAAILALFATAGLYRPVARPPMHIQAMRSAACFLALSGSAIGFAFLFKNQGISFPISLLIWFALGTLGCTGGRLLRYSLSTPVEARAHESEPAFLVGPVAEIRDALTQGRLDRCLGMNPVGVFVTDGYGDLEGIGNVPILGHYRNIGKAIALTGVQRVYIAAPRKNRRVSKPVLSALEGVDADCFLLLPDMTINAGTPQTGRAAPSHTYHTLAIQRRPLGAVDRIVKRKFDLVLSALGLLAISPLLLLIALAIKLDSRGPVLFKQPRYGLNDQLITVYKFRTMFTSLADTSAHRSTERDDPRVTRVGRFLRQTSLDELPQLINVLQGRMSLVGPRPHAPGSKAGGINFREAVPGYIRRHRVKPGITGEAQVRGWRGPTETVDKLENRITHDISYIEDWSFWRDIKILAKTPLALAGETAF